jgi:hypothetical protein
VNFADRRRPPWLRPIIAIAVAVCVVVSVIGFGLLRFEVATSAPPPSVPASLSADDIERADPDHDSSPVTQKAVRSVARHRALTPGLRSLPPLSFLVSAPMLWYRPGAVRPGVSATCLGGQELLTQFCIARR